MGGRTVTNDVVTRDFEKLKAQGLVIMNPYDSWTCDVTSGNISGLYSYATAGGPGMWSQTVGNHADLSCGWGVEPPNQPTGITTVFDLNDVSALHTEVSTRCLSQVGRTPTDNWENLAEISKTIDLLKNPIDQFWRFDRRFWSNARQMVLQGTKSVSALWITYRYGVRPLVESVRGTLEELKKQKPERVTSRAKGVISGSKVLAGSTVSGSFTAYWANSITATVQVRAMSLDELQVGDWPWALGVSTKSLLTLPWEMIPSSFVADWFVNVGDFYGAFMDRLHPGSLGRALVHKEIVSSYRETSSNSSPGSTIVTPMRDWVRVDDVYTKRHPRLAEPGLVVKSDFRLDKLTRASDALALIAVRIRSFTKLAAQVANVR